VGDFALDARRFLFRLVGVAVGEQPARAFRQGAPDVEDDDRQCRPDQEA
jgi:hypothetical protein